MIEIKKDMRVKEKFTGVKATITVVDEKNNQVWLAADNGQIGLFALDKFWECFDIEIKQGK